MDSFAEVIRDITKKGTSRPIVITPNTDPLAEDSITDIRNITASRVLKKAAEKSEKAFNSALNNYFKKFGLKYKNGKLTAPTVDKAIERTAKKASKSGGGSTQALADVIKIVQTINGNGGAATIDGTKMLSTDPLQPGSITDLRNLLKRGE